MFLASGGMAPLLTLTIVGLPDSTSRAATKLRGTVGRDRMHHTAQTVVGERVQQSLRRVHHHPVHGVHPLKRDFIWQMACE